MSAGRALALLLVLARPAPGLAQASPAVARAAGGPADAATALTPEEAAGRRIYTTGEGEGGITALLAGDRTPVPAGAFPCAACHGDDGLGRPEGTVAPPDVTWRELTRPGGHAHGARRHGPFDPRTLARAVEVGLDPDGNALDPAMPRYSMSRADREALLAWLRVLERQADPGLAPGAIRLGTVLPLAGALQPRAEALRDALLASLAALNAAGGLHGRRLELEVAGYDPAREDPVDALEALQRRSPSFALLAPFAPGAEAEVAAWAERAGIPQVAPYTPTARPARREARLSFYLQPGLAEQARLLVEHAAAAPGARRPRALLLRPDGDDDLAEAAAAAGRQAAARGWRELEEAGLPEVGPAAPDVARWRRAGVEVVILLGGSEALAGLLARATEVGWGPLVLAPGVLAARGAAPPPGFTGRVRLCAPSVPEAEDPAARARLARLVEGRASPATSGALAAGAAASGVLAEALARAGRTLSRARLVAALEGFNEVPAGLATPVSFGPRRRVGAMGGWLVEVDPVTGRFQPVGGYLRLE